MDKQQEQVIGLFKQFLELALGYGLDVLGAVAILIAGIYIAGRARRFVVQILHRAPGLDDTLEPVISDIVRYAILVFVLIAVLAQFGVQTTSVIALLGVAGLAVGLSLLGTLKNIAAGIMLLLLRPFRIGDYIDAEGLAGTVEEIGIFSTHLRTLDGVYLNAPNGRIWNRAILNYSRAEKRRLDIVVDIAYDDDIDKAQAALLGLMTSDSRVNAEPEAQVMVKELGDSSVNLNLRCWTDAGNYWALLFDLNKAAKLRLDAEGISIPFPQRDVHLFEENKS